MFILSTNFPFYDHELLPNKAYTPVFPKISLYKSGTGIYLDVFNTADYVDPSTVSRLFDRFYRTDPSRSSETGGHGIGLSMASKAKSLIGVEVVAAAVADASASSASKCTATNI